VVASKTPASEWSRHFDTVSVCFSKGLGAPVGSALAGTREMIAVAHRHRKMFGGGMRQAGIIAAGALYALRHQIDRLADDHALAAMIGDAVEQIPGLTLQPPPETNIVIFHLQPELGTAGEFSARLAQPGNAPQPEPRGCATSVRSNCRVCKRRNRRQGGRERGIDLWLRYR
jgi:threonine aldolase